MGDTISQTRSERVSIPSYDSPLLRVNTPGSDEERIELKELMDMCTKLSNRVLDLENNKSRTLQPERRVYKPRVESSEVSLEVIADQEETIELVEAIDPVTTAGETVTIVSVNHEDSIAVDFSLTD
ncbi:hypothetical protein Tco_0243765, partial [Tanacetum coccineum]